MDLLFSSASLLGLNYEFEFIGENFNFRNRKDLSIEGEVIISSGTSGVLPIWTGISGIISTQTDYKNIILNGVSFGSGRLNSINFDPGVDVRRKKYNASFSVFSTGNFSNLNQSGYSGLYTGFQAQDVKNIESLDESFDFQVNSDNTYTYNRQLNFNLQSGRTDADLTTLHTQAKSIASLIFQSDVTFPFLNSAYPSFYEANGRKIYTENYDLINSSYSFSEVFTFQNSNNYIWVYDYSLSTDENGETVVVEKGKFRGIDSTKYAAALAAFNTNYASSYNRCSGIYDYYYGSTCYLKNAPISVEIDRDSFIGEINYSINYSTSEKYASGVIWDKTHSCEYSDGAYKVSEQGSVVGLGVRTARYAAASAFFTTPVLAQMSSRIAAYYTSVQSAFGGCSQSFLEESRSMTDSEFDGKIEYDFSYSSDSRLNAGQYTFIESNYTDSLSTPLFNNIGIIGDNSSEYAVGVYRGNSALGNYKFEVNVKTSGSLDINTLLQYSKTQVSKSSIPSAEYFLKDASYSYDFNNKKFNLDVGFNYVKNRTLNNIII